MGPGQTGQIQLPGDLGLGAQTVGLGQTRSSIPQTTRQRPATAAQHDGQRRMLTPAGTAETCLDQVGNLVRHGLNIGEIDCFACHVAMIDAMADGCQTS